MEIVFHLVVSFLTTLGFSFFFHAPVRAAAWVGVTGALGWTVYILMGELFHSVTLAIFIGSVVIGLAGELFAHTLKLPVTVFVIPGIVPLVPGYGLYLVMFHLISNDYPRAMEGAVEVVFVGGAISIAIILVSSLSRILKRNTRAEQEQEQFSGK